MARRTLKRRIIPLLLCNLVVIGLMLNPAVGIRLVMAACGTNCWDIVETYTLSGGSAGEDIHAAGIDPARIVVADCRHRQRARITGEIDATR